MDLKKIEDIKNNILKEMEKLNSEKEEQKTKKKVDAVNRDLELARNWQKRYIENNRKDGKSPVNSFIQNNLLNDIDKLIAEQASKGIITNRSKIINIAIDFYLKNKDKIND